MKKHFSIRESLAFGLSTFRKRPVFFIGLTLITALVSFGFSFLVSAFLSIFLSQANENVVSVIDGMSRFLGFFLTLFVQLGITSLYLKSVDGESPAIGELQNVKDLYLHYLLTVIITGAISVVGYIFFIIPGIILSIMLQFAPLSLIDEKQGFARALQASRDVTRGVRLKLFAFSLVSGCIVFLGILCFGVGIFVAVPVVTLAQTYAYRTLKQQTTV